MWQASNPYPAVKALCSGSGWFWETSEEKGLWNQTMSLVLLRQVRRQADRQTGRQADRQTGRVHRLADRQAGREGGKEGGGEGQGGREYRGAGRQIRLVI